MRKIVSIILRLSLAIVFSLAYFIGPLPIKAKTPSTIKELRANLEELKAKSYDTQKKKQSTQQEIAAKKQNISKAYNEKNEIADKVEETKNKIIESEDGIKKALADIDNVLRYYQLNTDNSKYMSYVTGASSTTDMIMRASAVEQITTYYKNKVESLKNLIKEKQQLQVDLTNQSAELDTKIDNYANALDTLTEDLAVYNDVYEDLDTQIERAEEQIKYYKTICNSEDQQLSTCTNDPQSYGWTKPLVKGRVSSDFGYRSSLGDYHYGVDIAGNPEGTPEYAAAAGRVAFIKRYYNGGNTVYIYVTVNGQKYTLEYAHMLTVNVQKNQIVTVDTVVGTVGGYTTSALLFPATGYDHGSYGAHLHFGVAKGWYGVDYNSWSQWQAHNVRAPGIPKPGVWWYHR